MAFCDSADGRKFVAEEVDDTVASVREAIAVAAKNLGEAEAIFKAGQLPGCGTRESHDRLYELVYRNEPCHPSDLRWHGDADWALRAAGRLRENQTAGYVATGYRRTILKDEELTVFAAGDDRIAEQPNPIAGRSGRIWTYVSLEQIELAQRGTVAAQALSREIVLVRSKADNMRNPAQMVRTARDWLIDHDPDPSGHAVVGLVSDRGVETVSIQRFDLKGQPGTTTNYQICREASPFLQKTASYDAEQTTAEPLSRSGHEVITSPLDRRFRGRVVVDEAEFEWLSSAYAYGAASTVPGVIAALQVLKARVSRGETIWLFEPGTMYQLEVHRLPAFEDYVRRHFPDLGPI